MYNLLDYDFGRERHERMLREAEVDRMVRSLRGEREHGRRLALAWELRRYGGQLRKLFRRF